MLLMKESSTSCVQMFLFSREILDPSWYLCRSAHWIVWPKSIIWCRTRTHDHNISAILFWREKYRLYNIYLFFIKYFESILAYKTTDSRRKEYFTQNMFPTSSVTQNKAVTSVTTVVYLYVTVIDTTYSDCVVLITPTDQRKSLI